MFDPNQLNGLLQWIEFGLRNETLTVGKTIDSLTVVCLTEQLALGASYHQMQFDLMPPHIQDALKGKAKGDVVGPFKIVAVYDTWPVGLNDQDKKSA